MNANSFKSGIFAALLGFNILPVLAAPEASKPTISVAATQSTLPVWQPTMGEGLAQIMITELSKLPNIQVLESVALDDLREERSLGEGGEIEKKERTAKGHWKGADYTFKTSITRFGSKESTSGGGGFIRGPARDIFSIRKSESEVQIDWRVIDNSTRAVILSGRGVGMEKGGGWSFGGINSSGFNQNREFMDSALGKATMKAVNAITTELESWTPPARSGRQEIYNEKELETVKAAATNIQSLRKTKGEVLLVENGKVWISLGSGKGFSKGDHLKVYRPVEKKNKAGKVVAVDYQAAGEVELTKVQKDKSCGELKGLGVEEGWIVAAAEIEISELE